jgi:hypothetical protein
MMSMGFQMRLQQRLECRTCRDSAQDDCSPQPKNLATGEVSLVGCVILGVCPSCSRSGMSDDAIRNMVRRLSRPRAPMCFSRGALAEARAALRRMDR